MKMIDDVIIIGIDSGYGNIKTANCCFPASLSAYDREPVFKENLLVFESKFYLIGEGHKEFLADKTKDLDYYVLALAAIARELNIRKMTCGKIRIAAGLPLTWVSGQRDEFRDYLLQNKAVDFSFRSVSYHVEIVGVDVFPQGFAAVADRLSDFRGVNMICDIGNGTMNIMFINDKKPVSRNMFTEKYGTHQCLLTVRENVMRAHIDDDIPYISVRRAWRSVNNRPEVTTLLKTPAAKRDIPIPQLLVDCLKAEKEKSLSDYVISDSNGEPLSDSQFCRLWHYITARRVKERKIYRYINGEKIHHTISPKLGERCRTNKSIYYTLDFHVTPHLLRHTYITNLIHEGVDPKTVQYLAGHENSKVTMDIYAKVKYNKPWELAPVINQAFSTNSEEESA